jgi:hypothetical protein
MPTVTRYGHSARLAVLEAHGEVSREALSFACSRRSESAKAWLQRWISSIASVPPQRRCGRLMARA